MFRESQQIGLYTLIRKLGKGGFGEVWLAENRNNSPAEKVAIKLPTNDQIDLQALKDEIFNWILSGRHKNILPIIECETFGNQIAIVSEFASDGSLQDLLNKHGSFSVPDAVEIAIGILAGLSHLHNRKIIHRDLKPDNVLFQSRTPRLTDFGISRVMSVGTRSQTISGTLSYMAPEAFDGKRNSQTDIWSVGVILYQLLTGKLPFPQKERIELIGALVMKEPAPLPDSVSPTLQNIVKKSLAKESLERYQTADDMRKELEKVLADLQKPTSLLVENYNQRSLETLEAEEVTVEDKRQIENKPGEIETEKLSKNHLTVTKPSYEVPSVITNIREELETVEKKKQNFLSVDKEVHATNKTVSLIKKNKTIIGITTGLTVILTLFLSIYFTYNRVSNTSNENQQKSSLTTNNKDTIRVGVYSDVSGQTAFLGQSTTKGIEMAFDEINSAGGINGQKLEISFEDDEGAPDKAKKAVSKLINQNKVVALLGEATTINSLAAAPVAQEAKIPMITPSSTNVKVTQVGDYISRVCFIDSYHGLAMAKFAANNLKAETAAILGDVNSDYSKELAQFFEREFIQQGGRIISKESYSQTDNNFKEELIRIRNLQPDVIYLPGYYGQVGLIAKQARELGMQMPILGGDGWDSPEIWTLGGEAMKNTFISNHYSADNPEPVIQNFIKAYKIKYKKTPDTLAALGYDAAKLLADAIKRAGGTESTKLKNAINETKNFIGVTGSITLDANRNPIKPAVVLALDPTKREFIFKGTISP